VDRRLSGERTLDGLRSIPHQARARSRRARKRVRRSWRRLRALVPRLFERGSARGGLTPGPVRSPPWRGTPLTASFFEEVQHTARDARNANVEITAVGNMLADSPRATRAIPAAEAPTNGRRSYTQYTRVRTYHGASPCTVTVLQPAETGQCAAVMLLPRISQNTCKSAQLTDALVQTGTGEAHLWIS
jgi:hypothetical protein